MLGVKKVVLQSLAGGLVAAAAFGGMSVEVRPEGVPWHVWLTVFTGVFAVGAVVGVGAGYVTYWMWDDLSGWWSRKRDVNC